LSQEKPVNGRNRPEFGAMADQPRQTVYYKRARFTTRLPVDRLYSHSHYWLVEERPGVFRIGLTKFATRMLGDFVELQFVVSNGDSVDIGQPIGTIEGFKAVSEIYSVAAGNFGGGNDALDRDPTLLEREPYESGWLYRVTGACVDSAIDVHGYIGFLDATIDRMLLEQSQGSKEKTC
jgi:glycine cleavage system H protein